MAKLTGEAKREFLARMAKGRAKKGKKKSAAKKPRAKKSTHGLATTRGAAALGKGSTATRLHTVETAVRDLATANRAIVSKVVDHEKRLQKTETILDRWARGRGK